MLGHSHASAIDTHQLHKRGSWLDFIKSIALGETNTQIAGQFGDGIPPICVGYTTEAGLKVAGGKIDDGHVWTACFIDGDYKLQPDDIYAASCLLGLHQKQSSVCISVAGSTCANLPDGAYHGPIVNGRGAKGNDQKFDDAQRNAAVAGLSALAGIGMRTDDGVVDNMFSIGVLQDPNDPYGFAIQLDYHFPGGETC